MVVSHKLYAYTFTSPRGERYTELAVSKLQAIDKLKLHGLRNQLIVERANKVMDREIEVGSNH